MADRNSTRLLVVRNSTRLQVGRNRTRLMVGRNSTRLMVGRNSTRLTVGTNSTRLTVSGLGQFKICLLIMSLDCVLTTIIKVYHCANGNSANDGSITSLVRYSDDNKTNNGHGL